MCYLILTSTFMGIQKSGHALITGSRMPGSLLMHNLWNPPWQYSKYQTRAEQIKKCLYEGLESTYHSDTFTLAI